MSAERPTLFNETLAAEICRRARAAGIFTIVDGAHVPAHIPLHLDTLDADIYTGACHKWLCAPKGSAFLWARRDVQPMLRPLVVSWGWEPAVPGPSPFIDHHQWQGTRDLSAFLATPAAIDYEEANDWDGVRHRCHAAAVAPAETNLAELAVANAPAAGEPVAAAAPAAKICIFWFRVV